MSVCKVKSSAVGDQEFCESLTSCLEERNSLNKGLSVVVLADVRTLKESYLGVRYRQKKHAEGILLHACPFCLNVLLGERALTGHRDEEFLRSMKEAAP